MSDEDRGSLEGVPLTAEDVGAEAPVTLARWKDVPDPPPRAWVIEDWIPAGAVTLLAVADGVGKSRLDLQLAAAVAGGGAAWMAGDCSPTVGESGIEGAAVLATWKEDAAEIARKLSDISGPAAEWCTREMDLWIAGMRGRAPLWESGPGGAGTPTPTFEGLKRVVAGLDAPAALVVLDALAAIYAASEIDRAAVRGFLASMDRWAMDTGAAVLLVAHPPKSGADYSGSTDWLAGVRAMVTLARTEHGPAPKGKTADNRPLAWRLESVKTSWAAPPAALRLDLDTDKGLRWATAGPWEGAETVARGTSPNGGAPDDVEQGVLA